MRTRQPWRLGACTALRSSRPWHVQLILDNTYAAGSQHLESVCQQGREETYYEHVPRSSSNTMGAGYRAYLATAVSSALMAACVTTCAVESI
jgi:hypothetical protein